MSHLSVAKFGGTSVANYPAMQSCANIVIADPNTRNHDVGTRLQHRDCRS